MVAAAASPASGTSPSWSIHGWFMASSADSRLAGSRSSRRSMKSLDAAERVSQSGPAAAARVCATTARWRHASPAEGRVTVVSHRNWQAANAATHPRRRSSRGGCGRRSRARCHPRTAGTLHLKHSSDVDDGGTGRVARNAQRSSSGSISNPREAARTHRTGA